MLSETLTIVSVNTEGYRHMRQRVIPFIKDVQPEVVLFQDCFRRGANMAADALGLEPAFAPHWTRELWFDRGNRETCGVATLSRHGFVNTDTYCYAPGSDYVSASTTAEESMRVRRAVLLTEVEKGSERFRFGNVYFTWTPDGQANNLQRRDLQTLLKYLCQYNELVLCGDFNAPRGREIFSMLSQQYKDNIPPNITSTLDPEFHDAARIKGLQLVVDGLFTTSGYSASDVQVINGVSDHCAITANIFKFN